MSGATILSPSHVERGKLPNLRDLIIPDEGMTIVDMDLQRADIYVVARDSGCKLLLERLRTEDVHTRHAMDFLGKCTKYERDLMKKLAHAGNYLVGVRKASNDTGLSEAKIKEFLTYWYETYPEIGGRDRFGHMQGWHARVQRDLINKRMVHNAYGYRRPFFDRLDDCLPEAVAWIPQSTVGITINKALDRIKASLPQVEVLLQVHDSLTMQVRTQDVDRLIPMIEKQSLIEIPYDPPLIIPVEFKVSNQTWGKIEKWKGGQNG